MNTTMVDVCSLQGTMSSINVILNTESHDMWTGIVTSVYCPVIFAIENYELYHPGLYVIGTMCELCVKSCMWNMVPF